MKHSMKKHLIFTTIPRRQQEIEFAMEQGIEGLGLAAEGFDLAIELEVCFDRGLDGPLPLPLRVGAPGRERILPTLPASFPGTTAVVGGNSASRSIMGELCSVRPV
jgi:hypothetical protein